MFLYDTRQHSPSHYITERYKSLTRPLSFVHWCVSVQELTSSKTLFWRRVQLVGFLMSFWYAHWRNLNCFLCAFISQDTSLICIFRYKNEAFYARTLSGVTPIVSHKSPSKLPNMHLTGCVGSGRILEERRMLNHQAQLSATAAIPETLTYFYITMQRFDDSPTALQLVSFIVEYNILRKSNTSLHEVLLQKSNVPW